MCNNGVLTNTSGGDKTYLSANVQFSVDGVLASYASDRLNLAYDEWEFFFNDHKTYKIFFPNGSYNLQGLNSSGGGTGNVSFSLVFASFTLICPTPTPTLTPTNTVTPTISVTPTNTVTTTKTVTPTNTNTPTVTPSNTSVSNSLPKAVLLTSGTSYIVPSGAEFMIAYVVGAGSVGGTTNRNRAGSVVHKSWLVSGGETITYSIPTGGANTYTGSNINAFTTLTFNGNTIQAWNGYNSPINVNANDVDPVTGKTYLEISGGDSLVFGGVGSNRNACGSLYDVVGGAIGGNITSSCLTNVMTDINNEFKYILGLAGVNHTNDCSNSPPAFGRGARKTESDTCGNYIAGLGGGGADIASTPIAEPGGPAIVLYFTVF